MKTKCGLALLGLLFLLPSLGFTTPLASINRVGEVLSAAGTLKIQGKNAVRGSDKTLFQGALVETSHDGFMHLHLEPGIQLKSRAMTTLELGMIRDLRIFQVKLLRGTAFIMADGNGRTRFWTTEVITPIGTVSVRTGQGLVIFDSLKARLQIFCTQGSLHFTYNSLEYVLNPGETISVRDEKVASKSEVSGSQNRFLYSWYQQGQPWVLPPYFQSLRDLHKSTPPTLKNFSLNGLRSTEWESYQSFSPADLILGQIRMEGTIENFLPHQVVQVSLNGGKDFFDLRYENGFVLKLDPEDRIYEVVFRLRDLEKYYDVVHEELIFFFQSRGNRELVLQWADQLMRHFNQKNTFEISRLLEECRSLPISLLEELDQEFSTRNFQKLDMVLYRYRESRGYLSADFRWHTILGDTFRREPVKEGGRFQIVFERKRGPGVYPYSITGDLPFLNSMQEQRLDRAGPGISGPLSVPTPAQSPTTINLRIRDQLSSIKEVEYFIDRVGRSGTGRVLRALDGEFDERNERTQLILAPFFRAERIYVHARDARGNWGPYYSVTIGL